MGDLKSFAKRIREIGEQVEVGSNRLVVEVALAVDQTVVLATPVDTGRARGNWQVGIGQAVTEESADEDKVGQRTIDRNKRKVLSRKSGQSIFISNNLPYIRTLNEGHSAQAPEGFVNTAVLEGVKAVKRSRILRRR